MSNGWVDKHEMYTNIESDIKGKTWKLVGQFEWKIENFVIRPFECSLHMQKIIIKVNILSSCIIQINENKLQMGLNIISNKGDHNWVDCYNNNIFHCFRVK